MSTLLLRLAGPMQSWGTQSRFTYRDTGLEPSRSGVIGLLCAALGRPRHEPLDDFRELSMGVRVDREGELRRDFQTAGGGKLSVRPVTVSGRDYGVIKASGKKGDTVISYRDYLADADFLVALSGDQDFLARISRSLIRPVWPLFLGRKSFVPAEPVLVDPSHLNQDGLLTESDPASALQAFPLRLAHDTRDPTPVEQRVRFVLETDNPERADARPFDNPVSFDPRKFTTRFTFTEWVSMSARPSIRDEEN